MQSADEVITDERVGDTAQAWRDRAIGRAVAWLEGSQLAPESCDMYATDLGVPRERWSWTLRGTQRPGHRMSGPAFFPWCAAHGVNPFALTDVGKIVEWRDALWEAGVQRALVSRRLTAVRNWYAAAVAHGETTLVPNVSPGDRVEVYEFATPVLRVEQVRALRFAARFDNPKFRERNAAVLDLLAVGGLRPVEVCRLNMRDVITGRGTGNRLVVVEQRRDADRTVTLSGERSEVLGRYLKVRRAAGGAAVDPADPLCVTRYGNRLTLNAVLALPNRLCKVVLDQQAKDAATRAAAALLAPLADTLSVADLRRFAAATAYRKGAALADLHAWLGLPALGAAAELLGVSPSGVSPSELVAEALDAGAEAKTD